MFKKNKHLMIGEGQLSKH